jgi:magnesium transporter
MAHTRLYRGGKLELEDFPVKDISEYVKDPEACVWLDYC